MFRAVFFGVFVINIFSGTMGALMHLDWDSDRYPFNRQLHEDVLDPELCERQLDYLVSDVGLSARFLDAGLRIPRSILEGNTIDLGNFHQCLAINEKAEDMTINGKYCRISVPVRQEISIPDFIDRSNMRFDPTELQIDKNTHTILEIAGKQKAVIKSSLAGSDDVRLAPDSPLANVSFSLAACIPRPCSTEQALNGLLFNLTDIGFQFTDISCRLPDDRPWVAADYVAICHCQNRTKLKWDHTGSTSFQIKKESRKSVHPVLSVIFSIIGFLTVISTCYDLYQSIYLKKGPKEISAAYTSFSVYTNTRRLVTFNSSPGSLECLDGIRALAILWVILGHSFFTVSVVNNPIDAFLWTTSARALWITVGPLTVDTFFFLSGLLLVYTTVGKVGPMQLLKNLHVFYLHRLLRMFPILAAVILFEASFYMHVTDGPLWENVASQVFRCREFWWSTLFHLQNIVNPREACVGVTWYLAIDVQLHILSPIILFWVFTSRRAAWTALNTGLIATLTASTVFIFFQNLPSGIISPTRDEDMKDFYIFYYVNILTRASPFLVGMIYGYILHLLRNKSLHVPKVLSSTLLLCFLLTMLVVMYCSQISMTLDWNNQLADNFFNSFLRPTWALALGWIVFACVQGTAGPINWFLSLSMWKLPARLSYAMYLIHMPIMISFYATIFSPIHFTVPAILFNFMAFMFTTFILSFFVTLLIDSPFSTIFKLVLDRGYKKPETVKTTIRENGSAVDRNGRVNYSFAVGEENKKHQPTSQNGDLKLNINEGDNTLLTAK